MAALIDGKGIAAQIEARVADGVHSLCLDGGCAGLAVILLGEDPASQVHVNRNIKQTIKVGMRSIEHRPSAAATETELLMLIDRLNSDDGVHGILVELPLPMQINAAASSTRSTRPRMSMASTS